MKLNVKIILSYVIPVVIAGTLGYSLGRGQKEVQIVEKEGKVITEVVTRTVTKEHVTRPDGTIEEREVTEDRNEDRVAIEKERQSTVKPTAHNYSLGVGYRVDSYKSVISPDPRHVEVEAARRILGDYWITVGGGLSGVTLGVRYDF